MTRLLETTVFKSHHKNDNEVPLDFLFFCNNTDEEKQNTLEVQEEGEIYKVEYNSRRKKLQERGEEVRTENVTGKDDHPVL